MIQAFPQAQDETITVQDNILDNTAVPLIDGGTTKLVDDKTENDQNDTDFSLSFYQSRKNPIILADSDVDLNSALNPAVYALCTVKTCKVCVKKGSDCVPAEYISDAKFGAGRICPLSNENLQKLGCASVPDNYSLSQYLYYRGPCQSPKKLTD